MTDTKPREFWIYDNGEEPCLAFQDYDSIVDNNIPQTIYVNKEALNEDGYWKY